MGQSSTRCGCHLQVWAFSKNIQKLSQQFAVYVANLSFQQRATTPLLTTAHLPLDISAPSRYLHLTDQSRLHAWANIPSKATLLKHFWFRNNNLDGELPVLDIQRGLNLPQCLRSQQLEFGIEWLHLACNITHLYNPIYTISSVSDT